MANAHSLHTAHFTRDYVEGIRRRMDEYRRQLRALERAVTCKEIARELAMIGLDPALADEVFSLGLTGINERAETSGVRGAVQTFMKKRG